SRPTTTTRRRARWPSSCSRSSRATYWREPMSAATPSGLRALLEAERECCARLLLVLDAERAAAAAFDYAALIACLKERETVHAEWSHAAAARRTALRADGRTLAAIAAAEPALAGVVAALRSDAAALARAQR